MKILITGAAGCLGRRLVQSLQDSENTQVFATDIKPELGIDIDSDKCSSLHYKPLDVCKPEFYQWVEEVKPDVIVHLASILQISKAMPREKAYEIRYI